MNNISQEKNSQEKIFNFFLKMKKDCQGLPILNNCIKNFQGFPTEAEIFEKAFKECNEEEIDSENELSD